MRRETITIYKADELNEKALRKAYDEFMAFHLEDLKGRPPEANEGIKVYLTIEEFVQTSNTNGYEYLSDGTFLAEL